MSDAISKASVCEIIADIYPTDGEKVVAVKEIDKAYEAILHLPIIENRPKGKWIFNEDEKVFRCNKCGNSGLSYDDFYVYDFTHDNFCPNCGAEMI